MTENFSEYTRPNGTRIYVKDNKNYISLTTLLSRYEDKTVLTKWRERIGEEEATAIGNTARDRGTLAHRHIEHFYGLYPDEDIPEYNKYAQTAIQGFYGYVEPIEIENVVFYEHPSGARVAGRYDALLNMNPNTFKYKHSDEYVIGGKLIADLKTKDKTPRFDKIDFVFKHLLQISSYSKILSLTSEHDVSCATVVYATVLKTKEHCKVLYLDRERIDFYWGLTQELLLDFFKIKPLKKSWNDMIALAYCDLDTDTGDLIDYCPREIYYSNGCISDNRLSSESE